MRWGVTNTNASSDQECDVNMSLGQEAVGNGEAWGYRRTHVLLEALKLNKFLQTKMSLGPHLRNFRIRRYVSLKRH